MWERLGDSSDSGGDHATRSRTLGIPVSALCSSLSIAFLVHHID